MSIFNIFRKPKVAPPTGLHEPKLDKLEPIMKKYEGILNQMADSSTSKLPSLWRYKTAFAEMIFLNFNTISQYMENEVYQHSLERKRSLEQNVNNSTVYAAACGWVIGNEWGKKDLNLRKKLQRKNRIGTQDVPSDAMELLNHAAYFPYWVFATIFTDYYNSWYGQRVRRQRDAHLKDTYQGIMNSMLMCFLAGIKET